MLNTKGQHGDFAAIFYRKFCVEWGVVSSLRDPLRLVGRGVCSNMPRFNQPDPRGRADDFPSNPRHCNAQHDRSLFSSLTSSRLSKKTNSF